MQDHIGKAQEGPPDRPRGTAGVGVGQDGPERAEAGDGREAAGPARTRIGLTPPSSKGGCQRVQALVEGPVVRRGVDYATYSLTTELADSVLGNEGRQVGDWVPKRFFGRASEFMVPGGSVWWKREPVSPSKRWGSQYDVIEASGAAGAWLAERLASHVAEVNCTRFDLAVDVQVDGELSPGDVVRPLSVTGEADGLQTETGFSIDFRAKGPAREWPWWVGRRGSGRMLRVYRKDLENPLLYPDDVGAVMRFELELLDPSAHITFQRWTVDEPSTWAAYGRHVYDMTQRELLPIGDLPDVPTRPAVEACQTVLQLIEQHGHTLDAAIAAGIDVVELAAARSARPVRDRGQKSRQNKRRMAIAMLADAFGGIDQLQSFLLEQVTRATLAKGVR